MKKTINESQLRAIVAESVKRVLKESGEGIEGGYEGGYLDDYKTTRKYGEIIDKVEDAGEKEIEYIMQKYNIIDTNNRNYTETTFTPAQVHAMLDILKKVMVEAIYS